jgi:hypothetical protein
MRSIHADLTATQKASTATPHVRLNFRSRDRATTRTYATNDATNRILSVQYSEGRLGGGVAVEGLPFTISCIIRLQDYDGSLVALDWKGYRCDIGWGYSASGTLRFSEAGPVFVVQERSISIQGHIVTELLCVSLWDYARMIWVVQTTAGVIRFEPGTENQRDVKEALHELLGGDVIPDTTSGAVVIYDASGPSYTNLNGAAKSLRTAAKDLDHTTAGTIDDVDILPAVPAVGDIHYIGRDTAFDRVTYDLTTPATGTITGVWEGWTGAGWTALDYVDDDGAALGAAKDGTTGFTVGTLRVVAFDQPAAWATLNASTAGPTDAAFPNTSLYYIRFRVTAISTPGQPIASRITVGKDLAVQLDTSDASQGDDYSLDYIGNYQQDVTEVVEKILAYSLLGVFVRKDGFHASYINNAQSPADYTYWDGITEESSPAVSGDDGYWNQDSPQFFNNSNTFIVAGYDNSIVHAAFIRFPSVNIPRGATISTAYVTLTARTGATGHTPFLKISANAVDDPAAPTSASAADALVETGSKVDWDFTQGAEGVEAQSPEIKAVVQEIVNRPGWEDGQAILLLLKDDGGSDTNDHFHMYSQDNGSKEAVLHIEYESHIPLQVNLQDSVVIPNKVIVTNLDPGPVALDALTTRYFSGTPGEDATSQAAVGVLPIIMVEKSASSNALCNTLADRAIKRLARDKTQGELVALLSTNQEIWDLVRVEDARTSQNFEGRVSALNRAYSPGVYTIEVRMGGTEQLRSPRRYNVGLLLARGDEEAYSNEPLSKYRQRINAVQKFLRDVGFASRAEERRRRAGWALAQGDEQVSEPVFDILTRFPGRGQGVRDTIGRIDQLKAGFISLPSAGYHTAYLHSEGGVLHLYNIAQGASAEISRMETYITEFRFYNATPKIGMSTNIDRLDIGDDSDTVRLGHLTFLRSTKTLDGDGDTIEVQPTTGVSGFIAVTPGAARTGIIVQAGNLDGQIMVLTNMGAAGQDIDFATDATSNVYGASVTPALEPGKALMLIWDSTSASGAGRWHPLMPLVP